MNATTASRCVVAMLGLSFAFGANVSGQNPDGLWRELDLLKEAALLEAAGDYAGAERVLVQALDRNPGSLPGLLQVERVLLVQGRAHALLPIVERVLTFDAGSAIAHQIRVRALALLDRSEALAAAAEEWIAATPSVEVSYRELARLYQRRGEEDRAIRFLERGRDAVRRGDALALELGEANARLQRWDIAAHEWARAIGPDGRGLHAVERRLRLLPDGGAHVLPGLVDALETAAPTPSRTRAAAMLAVDAGLGETAVAIAGRLLGLLAPEVRTSFLVEFARRADGADVATAAYWAYRGLEATSPPREHGALWAVRSRIADLALLVGDTAVAEEVFRRMERAFDRGSPERRAALSMRVTLAARNGDTRNAEQALTTLSAEYPQARELDEASAELALAYLRAGKIQRATVLMEGQTGSYATRVRGLIALRQGEIDRARSLLLLAVRGLHGPLATRTIDLASLLLRISPRGGELVASLAGFDPPDPQGFDRVEVASRSLPDNERAAILDFAADVAGAAELPADASALLRVIVEEHPHSPEAPAALLTLARGLPIEPAASQEEARILLARLIVDYPRSALVPQARRELERLVPAGATR